MRQPNPLQRAIRLRMRLSCHDFADNKVRLQLFSLTYNLGNFLRRLALITQIYQG